MTSIATLKAELTFATDARDAAVADAKGTETATDAKVEELRTASTMATKEHAELSTERAELLNKLQAAEAEQSATANEREELKARWKQE